MTHTYRDSTILESKALQFVVFPLVVFLVLAALGASALAHSTWAERGEGAAALTLFFGLGYISYRWHRYGMCGEIRLGDDGTCEFETKRRVIRLHVNEIRSVAYSAADEGVAVYRIHYHGGYLPVTDGMTGFSDFLARLKTLNPAVDLTSFPPDRWPGLGTPATQERGTSVSRRIRGALFPVGVVAALIWLAIETLTTAK